MQDCPGLVADHESTWDSKPLQPLGFGGVEYLPRRSGFNDFAVLHENEPSRTPT